MKLGAENRNKTIAAAVLGVIALILFWHSFISGGPMLSSAPPAPVQLGPAVNSSAPNAATGRSGRRAQTSAAVTPIVNPLDPRLRLDLLKVSQETEYQGSGRNIFRAQAEPVIPKPLERGIKNDTKNTPPPAPQPQGPPAPPPIPFKAFGVATRAGQARQVILSQGDDVTIAKEGQVVAGHYKIVKINANSVEVEDLLNNNSQTIPISAG